MRLRWVGDSRDYVKWDCVFEKSVGYFVFYIPMLRASVDPKCGNEKVQQHFDQRKDLKQFQDLFPGGFDVFMFGNREYSTLFANEYFESVISRLSELQRTQHVLVFIDPDTGIEPQSGARDEHIRLKDLQLVWHSLRATERLIVYQHASRNSDWKERLATCAKVALSVDGISVSDLYCNEQISKDVCFLSLEKK